MCGIAGYIARTGKGRSSCAPRVLAALEHRGPDDSGWLRLNGGTVECGRDWRATAREPEALLLHRRLSILDTSEAGWQPMSTPDGRYHLVFNGEIYNYKELQVELAELGHTFRSHSDTEVLLAAYAQWGVAALGRFVGMFAFALLDVQRSVVLLARDFFGIKPLYYASEDGCLCFGSEIKALFAFGIADREANSKRLLYFLRYGMTDFGSETMLSAVSQLPPAHYMEVSVRTGDAEAPVCYWQPDAQGEMDISFDEAAEQLRELFLRSVALHLRSDVPLGSALSGGIDSSSIVLAMRRLNSKADIHAFSFVSDDAKTSEEHWIDLVGRAAGAQVHKVRTSSAGLLNELSHLMHFQDEPYARTSVHAQFEVFRAAREAGVKVMLDGQGADEILAGYRVYLGARLASLIRGGEWSGAAKLVNGMARLDGFGRFQGLAFCADYLLPPSVQGPARKLAGKEAFPSWLKQRWFADREADVSVSNYTAAQAALKTSLQRSLGEGLPSLLRYEDRNSMASSVESRVPFLTPEIVCFLGRLPEKYLVSPSGVSKAVFRKAMRGIVPDAVLDRQDKMGFVTPEINWLTELDGWVRKMLDSEAAHRLPFLDLNAVRNDWDAMRAGKTRFDYRIWRWVNLIWWIENLNVTFAD